MDVFTREIPQTPAWFTELRGSSEFKTPSAPASLRESLNNVNQLNLQMVHETNEVAHIGQQSGQQAKWLSFMTYVSAYMYPLE